MTWLPIAELGEYDGEFLLRVSPVGDYATVLRAERSGERIRLTDRAGTYAADSAQLRGWVPMPELLRGERFR